VKVSPFFLVGLGCVFAAGLSVLAVSLYRVQVVETAAFKEDQREQATRAVRVPGLRGRILDRAGRVLADSRPSRDVVCRPEAFRGKGAVARADAEIARLADVLRLERLVDRARIEHHFRHANTLPLTLWRDLDDAALARFAENAVNFPGFDLVLRAERTYPYGELAAHLLGYTGRDRPEATTDDDLRRLYEPELRGRAGLESRFNRYLAGATGEKTVRVDARGFAASEEMTREPAAGLDLRLTLDLRLQLVLERQLRGHAGAGVVLDPRDGAVLAMASAPAFNPNDFVPSLAPELYESLAADPLKPLLNRAISGTYAPGSTFKPVTALAALEAGWIPEESYTCTGVFTMGGLRLHCWDRYGHGAIDLGRAIELSCNTFFCNLGRTIGTNAVITTARAFGLGARTGIDLEGEAPGVVPDDGWKRANWNEAWYPGDVCQMSIGQGMLTATPLQMAVVCAALANGGRVYRPHLQARREDEPAPAPVRRLACRPEHLERVRRAMRDVVETGTGRRIRLRADEATRTRRTLAVSCAGKTGTAEVGRGATRRKNTWIIAFAPYENPTAAVAMVIENGESGGKTTAPKVQQVLAALFGEKEVE